MKRYGILLILPVLVLTLSIRGNSAIDKRPLQSNVLKGIYIHNDLVTMANLKKLPIPLTNEDYAFYQSIGKISNIVIGRFKSGDKQVTLVTDKNADGKVDFACTWTMDHDKMDIDPRPDETYGAAKFAQMKEEIVSGKSATLSPNPEGVAYMRVLMKRPSNISRMRNGFRITGYDPDEPTIERVSYFFSNNAPSGVDMAFEVKFNNLGTARIRPLIHVGVYCRNSFDPFTVSLVDKLSKETREVFYAK